MKRIAIVLSLYVIAASGAAAGSYRSAPNPCAAPANVAPYVADEGVSADGTDSRGVLDAPIVLETPLQGDGKFGRLFKEFVFTPEDVTPRQAEACPR